ncbi:hypothetical protein Zmor_027685 [Zophobas morio]|uniref:Uncharacterized protein n=1 Tax=Zophobas morio TaxID=2755281 RepID=A0AA38M2A8_9CUCU|nr:hypothetical protein Zmor_027685 [Zophobas morio]
MDALGWMMEEQTASEGMMLSSLIMDLHREKWPDRSKYREEVSGRELAPNTISIKFRLISPRSAQKSPLSHPLKRNPSRTPAPTKLV